MKNILFKISKLVSGFFLLFFSFFLILTILVTFKPIKINNLKALEDIKILEDFRVKEFGNVFLSFNQYSRNYEIFIEDVRTNNSLIPNILLGVRLKDILFLQLKPTILKLYDAEIEFNVEKKIKKQVIQIDDYYNYLLRSINENAYSKYLNDFQILEINNSSFKIQLTETENYIFSRLDLKIEKKNNDFIMSALFEQNEKLKSFAAFNAKKKNSKLVIDFSFEDFSLKIPKKYLKKINLSESKINLNGEYSLMLDKNSNSYESVSSLSFNSQIMKIFQGKIQKLNFDKGKIDIDFNKDFTDVNFDFFENGSKVIVSQRFSHKNHRKKYLKIIISEIKLEKFKIFWPEFYESSVKEWISENVSGDINKLNLTLKYDNQGLLENSLMQFSFSNTKIRYSEDKPVVTDLEGNASFDGREFKFDIFAGLSDKLALNNARVKIYDFDQEIEMADIQLEITGNNHNLINYLKKISFDSENIKRISKFDGNPILNLNLSFPLLMDLRFEDIKYDGQLNYNNARIPNFFQNYNLEKVKITINILDDRFDYKGAANLQKMNVKFSGIEHLNETVDFQNNLNINVDFDPVILNDYFPDFVKDIKGSLPLSLIYKYNLKDNEYKITVEGQMEKLSGFFPFFDLNHNYNKGNLQLYVSGKKKLNEKFEIKINTKDLNLFAEYSKYNDQLDKIIFHSIKSPSQDFNAVFRKKKNFWHADFSGSNLNLRKFLENTNSIENNNIPVKFDINTKSLVFKKNKILINSCNGILKSSRFVDLDLNFNTLKSKKNNIRIYDENGYKRLSIMSDNASEFLNVFGINPNLKSGSLSIEAKTDNDKNYTGNIKIKDFVAYDTPFFAKILTIFSLDGIEQKLKDGGIFFDKLNSNYFYSKGDIKFFDGIIRGSDLGLTFEGDFNSKTDDFKAIGTFIPAYTINTLLTSLPVVGDIITAGSPEDGILAASFELKKENDKFDINFNPISVLVPSLIRNLLKNE